MDVIVFFVVVNVFCFEEKEGFFVEVFVKVQEFFSYVDWLDCRVDVVLNVF